MHDSPLHSKPPTLYLDKPDELDKLLNPNNYEKIYIIQLEERIQQLENGKGGVR